MKDEYVDELPKLPHGWEAVSLGDLLIGIEAGKSFTCEPRPAFDGEWGVIKVSAMTWGTFNERENKAVPAGARFDEKNEIHEGDLLLSRSNTEGHVGASVLVGPCRPRLLLSDKSMRLLYSRSVSPRWLIQMLSSSRVRAELSASATGTSDSMRNVSQDKVRAVKMLLPPKSEQDRIASRIEELFSSIDEGERALERVRVLVERYRQSVLKAAVTGELTREWREQHSGELESGEALLTRILEARRQAWEKSELAKMTAKGQRPANDQWKKRYKEPEHPSVGALTGLPAGWAWLSVDQLCREFGNGLSKKPRHTPPGIPILRISAVRTLAVDPNDVRYYEAGNDEQLDKAYVSQGDLLFTRYNGSRELVGVSGVYEGVEAVLHPDKLIKARVVAESLVLPHYLALALNAGASANFLAGAVKTSAGQHGISGGDIKICPVPLPPIHEQETIASIQASVAERCSGILSYIATETARISALRQKVLIAAFEGKLVPQDPNDEPASVLLERIAAERTAYGSTARPKQKRAGKKKAKA